MANFNPIKGDVSGSQQNAGVAILATYSEINERVHSEMKTCALAELGCDNKLSSEIVRLYIACIQSWAISQIVTDYSLLN